MNTINKINLAKAEETIQNAGDDLLRLAYQKWLLLSILLLGVSGYNIAQTGIVEGQLLDGTGNDALGYANVVLIKEGAPVGTVTDEYGQYRLVNVPVGPQTIRLSFIGYATQDINIVVREDETTYMGEIVMQPENLLGVEVVVTGQLRGQQAAINQQVNSNTIVNVVSSERIREVPDNNAAETIGRLPGVTLSRNAGEGSQVTVRGASPRFNNVTINGQAVPPTGNSGRAVDLSLISSDILQGIEVFKALTPDKDGDAIGGSINLVTRTADEGFHGLVQAEVGYHSIIDDIGTYRGSATLSNRFFKEKFGLIVTGSAHRANRNADEFSADYETQDQDQDFNPIFNTKNINLTNRIETRDRYNASVTTDYRLRTGRIVLDYFFSNTQRDIQNRSVSFSPDAGSLGFGYGKSIIDQLLHSLSLRGSHEFGENELTWNVSRAITRLSTPVSYGMGASQTEAYRPDFPFDAPPELVPTFVTYNLDKTTTNGQFGYGRNDVDDKNWSAQVDFEAPVSLGTGINGYLKFGGKFRDKIRTREAPNFGIRDGDLYFQQFREEFPNFNRNDRTYFFSNFLDPDFSDYQFPNGETYVIPYGFDPDIAADIYGRFRNRDTLFQRGIGSFFNGYTANELILAGYGMAEINIGENVMVLAGARIESTQNDFAGVEGFSRGSGRTFSTNDTSATSTRTVLMPMMHLRYKFNEAFSLRLAATRSLSRPDFLNLTPFQQITQTGNNRSVNRGSITLDIPTAWNYDAIFTWFSKFGYVSLAGFYKQIYDIDIRIDQRDFSGDPESNPTYGYFLTDRVNAPEPTDLYGAELEIQTSFYFLPKPFDGITLSANYSLTRSETAYPFYPIVYPPPEFNPTVLDTFRLNRTQGQANSIANFTLGYEKGGFSGRVSMNYQGDKLATSGGSEFTDRFTREYLRWDASLTQRFGDHFQVLVNLINITDAPEQNYQFSEDKPTYEIYYGWQTNLGLRYRF
jgi:TonB-dependent receptor